MPKSKFKKPQQLKAAQPSKALIQAVEILADFIVGCADKNQENTEDEKKPNPQDQAQQQAAHDQATLQAMDAIEVMQVQVQEKEAAIAALKEENKTLQQRLDTPSAPLATLPMPEEDNPDLIQPEIQALQNEQAQQDEAIEQVRKAIQSVQQKINTLKKQDKQTLKLLEQNKQKTKSVKSLQQKTLAKQKEIEPLSSALDKLKQDCESEKTQIETHQKTIEALNKELASYQTRNQSAQKAILEAQAQLKATLEAQTRLTAQKEVLIQENAKKVEGFINEIAESDEQTRELHMQYKQLSAEYQNTLANSHKIKQVAQEGNYINHNVYLARVESVKRFLQQFGELLVRLDSPQLPFYSPLAQQLPYYPPSVVYSLGASLSSPAPVFTPAVVPGSSLSEPPGARSPLNKTNK